MKYKKNLQDKVSQATAHPSDRVWQKIETNLDGDRRLRRDRRNTVVGWAAAVFVVLMAYQAGKYEVNSSEYKPQTLPLSDHVAKSEVTYPTIQSYNAMISYRKDGQLIPNAQAIWENPLVPRTVDF